MNNLSVLAADNATTKTWTAVTPSSGSTPAVYRQDLGTAPAHKPELRVQGIENKSGTTRRIRFTAVYPEVDDSGPAPRLTGHSVLFEGTFVIPKAMTQTQIDEAAAQMPRLLTESAIREAFRTGFAPA